MWLLKWKRGDIIVVWNIAALAVFLLLPTNGKMIGVAVCAVAMLAHVAVAYWYSRR